MTAQNGDERSHFDTLGSFLPAMFISRIADFAQQIKRIDARLVTVGEMNVVSVIPNGMHDFDV